METNWMIAGVSLPALVFALVQFLKTQLNLNGIAVRWLSVFIGFSLGMLMLSAYYFGGLYEQVVTWVILCLNLALSGIVASSAYDAFKQAAGR